MSQYSDERYNVYDETERKARKAHFCDACHEPIRPGDRYFVIKWVFDGSANGVKRCLRCQAIHLHLRKLGSQDDMWPSETLSCGEEYQEHWGKAPPAHIAELAFFDLDARQSICFRVFRNERGDHFVAHSAADAAGLARVLGLDAEKYFEVPGDIGIPIVVDGSERFLHRSPDHYQRAALDPHWNQYAELHQIHDFQSAREWAVAHGVGLLCSGEPVGEQQGPLKKRWMGNW